MGNSLLDVCVLAGGRNDAGQQFGAVKLAS